MKEHDGDVGGGGSTTEASVEQSAVVADKTVTKKLDGGEERIKEFSGERDEGEEVVVDVVGTDDGHEGKEGDLGSEGVSDGMVKEGLGKETETRDVEMEDVGVLGGEVLDSSVETRVLTHEKVEVVVNEEVVERTEKLSEEVVRSDVVSAGGSEGEGQKSERETGVGDSNVVLESTVGETQVGGGEVAERVSTEEVVEQAKESVQEVADDEKTRKEPEVLDSSKMLESSTNLGSEEVAGTVTEESLTSKDEAPQNGPADPDSSCPESHISLVEVVKVETDVGAAENSDQPAEVNAMSKEEDSHQTIEVTKADVSEGNVHSTIGQQGVDVKPADGSSESHATADGDVISFPDTSKPFPGGGLDGNGEKVPSDSTVEISSEHHSSVVGGEDGVMTVSATSVSTVEHSEVVASIGTKVLSTGQMEGEVENQGLKVNSAIESNKADVAAGTEPESSIDQTIPEAANKVMQTVAESESCKVELPTTGDMSGSVEDRGLEVDAVNNSSKVDIAVCTVQEPSTEQLPLGNGNQVTAMHVDVPNSKVEVPTAGEGDGLQVSSEHFEGVNNEIAQVHEEPGVPRADFEGVNNEIAQVHEEPGVPRADPEFAYEEANVEVDDDPGMDIDEVLSWKGEIPGIDALNGGLSCPGKDQHFQIDGNAETNLEQGHAKSSHEPVLTGQREEDLKFRQPIVYERRAHVEFPHADAFYGTSSHHGKDENLKVETLGRNSEEADGSVQEQEPSVAVQSTNTPCAGEMVTEHVVDAKDSGVAGREHQSMPLVQDAKQVENSAPLQVAHIDVRGTNESAGVASFMGKDVGLGEHSGNREQADFGREQDTKTLETGIDDEITEPIQNETSVSLHQSNYFHPPENEGEFSVSDLVWGKIRSHPWWPGQIFDPADASEKAMKYHKKDCFLVAYFGDGTFAWNDSSVLKPFRTHFSQIEKKHNSSEAFHNAVSCALEEAYRRVELGLACSCISQDVYENMEYQVVENGGIRQESSRRHGVDNSAGVNSFEPDKLVDYVRLLAQFPYGEVDKLELAIAKAQLSSYDRYKGYRNLPEFQLSGDLLEGVADASVLGEVAEHVNEESGQMSDRGNFGGDYYPPHKVEDDLVDIAYPIKKEKSLSELMDDAPYPADGEDGAEGTDGNTAYNSVSSGVKKRKALDSLSDVSEKRPSLHLEKVTTTPALAPALAPRPSFKVGASILRVASQLTGSPSILKCSSDKKVEHGDLPSGFAGFVQSPENSQRGRMVVPGDQVSPDEMLSQLHLAAQDPMKGYSFLNNIVPFFSSYRSVVLSRSRRQNASTGRPGIVRKRKLSNENDPEEFEFDDVNDSYWTDRIIQNFSEEQLLQENQNGGGENQLVAYEQDKPVKTARRSNKKRFFNSNHEIEAQEQNVLVEHRRQNLATEVVLKFAEGIYFPSEMNLNKMFRRFGPLMESETEVDRQGGRARVVFKKCSDAEVAHSSAGKFNIFGSINVSYELNYTPLISYKPLPLPTLQDPEDAT